MKREFRMIARADIRAKSGKKPAIEGYAAVFNQLSEDLGWFREFIIPGAFTDCLASSPDVRCLFNHDANLVLGRTTAQTLTLAQDDKGLRFDCNLPETATARDLLTSITRGDISQCSFGFFVRQQKWAEETDPNGDTHIIRELHKLDVFDVSPVTFPAYPETSVDARALRRALWPDGRPKSVARFQPRRRGGLPPDPDEPDENRQLEDECECDCTACQDGNCPECTNSACDDETCAENGCPNQQRARRPAPSHSPAYVDDATRRQMCDRLRLAAERFSI